MEKRKKLKTVELVFAGIFTAIICICSWISIPTTVPFTLQTFAIFSVLCTLGGKLGLFSILAYIALGAVGVPVFSGFKGGIGVLAGPTGGYIVGFVFTALIFWLITAKAGDKLYIKILALTLGLLICYAFGTAWFMFVYTKQKGAISLMSVLGMCVFPFLLPDALKMAAALFISGRVKKYVKL